jgi:hypothetical protein
MEWVMGRKDDGGWIMDGGSEGLEKKLTELVLLAFPAVPTEPPA